MKILDVIGCIAIGVLFGVLLIVGLDIEIRVHNLELQSFRDQGYPLSPSIGEGFYELSAHNHNNNQ